MWTVTSEAGAGLAGFGLGLVTAWGIYGWSSSDCDDDAGCTDDALGLAVGIGALVSVFAIPAVVVLVGRGNGGNGTYWSALSGVLTGVAAAAGLVALASVASDGGAEGLADALYVLAIPIPFLGSAMGYEIANGAARPPHE